MLNPRPYSSPLVMREAWGGGELAKHALHRRWRDTGFDEELATKRIGPHFHVRRSVESDTAGEVAVGEEVAQLVRDGGRQFFVVQQVNQPPRDSNPAIRPTEGTSFWTVDQFEPTTAHREMRLELLCDL
jgi:hypothetical protein